MSAVLEGQVALVTGASRGIGRAVAMELARMGAEVIGTATSESGAAQIRAEARKRFIGDSYSAAMAWTRSMARMAMTPFFMTPMMTGLVVASMVETA